MVIASLKEFIRNWKSVLLLILLPLLVIASFFASFSAAGLQKVPIGIISASGVDLGEFKESLSGVLITKDFDNLDDCLKELKQYKQYICVDITKDLAYHLDVHYDNTKTLVIWGVINQIKTTVDWIKKEKTKQVAEQILEEAGKGPGYIQDARTELDILDRSLSEYSSEIDSGINAVNLQVNSAKGSVTSMGNAFSNVNTKLANLKYSRGTSKSNVVSNLNSIDAYAGSLLYLPSPANQYGMTIADKSKQAKNEFNVYDGLVVTAIDSAADESTNFYNLQSGAANSLQSIDSGVNQLSNVKSGLESRKGGITEVRNNLDLLGNYVNSVMGIDPESVADPIQMNFKPTYLPEAARLAERFKDADKKDIALLIKGETLLAFQVIFPKILLLIVMFLALLTSTFISINYLNSPANKRIMIVKGVFFPSFFSIFLSALFITLIPLIFVILLGDFLFLLPFVHNILLVLFVVGISASIYILAGMSLSYLIRDKSLTLLVSIFVLIFLLFFSGFILPIERMGAVPASIASNFPGNIAADILNKILFYDQAFLVVLGGLAVLLLTLFLAALVTLAIKTTRR